VVIVIVIPHKKSNHKTLAKLLFGGVPPPSPSHYLVRASPLMTNARYRSLSGKLLFEELK
jgi:hypothetical protein